MKHVVVIGGGASGMMAAITAAREGARVTIVEHKDRVGKKILSTGNGRCNFTNTRQEPECYRSENPSFPWGIIQQFDVGQTLDFFKELGIFPKDRNGYLYPNSDQASAVLDVLRMEVERLAIKVLLDTQCKQIHPTKKGFRIDTSENSIYADAVILSCGSKAAPVTGSDGSGYSLAKQLGHRMIPVLPALVQLKCKESFFKSIAGVRVQGTVSIYADNVFLAKDTGELQLTNYGISGIPVFQVSRYAANALYKKQNVTAVLNFMPDMDAAEFLKLLQDRIAKRPNKTVEEFLIGLFSRKLSDLWIKLGNFKRNQEVCEWTSKQLQLLAKLIQQLEVCVTETNSFEQAQICCGGVDTRDINPDTLESLLIPHLYFAGELLDVDGICGGYNLQWAWSSGTVAGREAAKNAANKSIKTSS